MFQYTNWPDMRAPSDPQGFLKLVRRVNKVFSDTLSMGPMILHCIAGVGRTGTFATVSILATQMKQFMKKREKLGGSDHEKFKFNIYEVVKNLKDCRHGMVQNKEQYEFCYQVIREEAKRFAKGSYGMELAPDEVAPELTHESKPEFTPSELTPSEPALEPGLTREPEQGPKSESSDNDELGKLRRELNQVVRDIEEDDLAIVNLSIKSNRRKIKILERQIKELCERMENDDTSFIELMNGFGIPYESYRTCSGGKDELKKENKQPKSSSNDKKDECEKQEEEGADDDDEEEEEEGEDDEEEEEEMEEEGDDEKEKMEKGRDEKRGRSTYRIKYFGKNDPDIEKKMLRQPLLKSTRAKDTVEAFVKANRRFCLGERIHRIDVLFKRVVKRGEKLVDAGVQNDDLVILTSASRVGEEEMKRALGMAEKKSKFSPQGKERIWEFRKKVGQELKNEEKEAYKNQIEEREEEIRAHKEKIHQLENKLKTSENSCTESTRRMEDRLQSKVEELRQMRKERDDFDNTERRLRQTLDGYDKERRMNEKESLKACGIITRLKREVEVLRDSLEQLRQTRVTKLEKNIQELNASLERVTSERDEFLKRLAKIEKDEKREVERLKEELKRTKKENDEKEEEMRRMQEEISKLKRENSELKRSKREPSKDIGRY